MNAGSIPAARIYIMPYILQEDRGQYNELVDQLADKLRASGQISGHMNYVISRMFWKILQDDGMKYTKANNMIGALGCVKLELYRRFVAPYEDKMIEENGDVFEERDENRYITLQDDPKGKVVADMDKFQKVDFGIEKQKKIQQLES